MDKSICQYESEIAAGKLSDELRSHLEGCAICRETHSAAMNMRRFADTLTDEPCPSAASVWWRLSLRMRREQARRAQSPLIWMTRILYAAIAVLAVFSATLIPHVLQPDVVQPVLMIGLLSLAAITVPIAAVLWAWHRSS